MAVIFLYSNNKSNVTLPFEKRCIQSIIIAGVHDFYCHFNLFSPSLYFFLEFHFVFYNEREKRLEKRAEMQGKLPGCAARSQQTGKSSWKMNHCRVLFAKHRLDYSDWVLFVFNQYEMVSHVGQPLQHTTHRDIHT